MDGVSLNSRRQNGVREASNQPLQPPHSAVTPRAEARVAPAGGRLKGER